jgi:PHS family inorganic phosphate transporter-like MFS transporter
VQPVIVIALGIKNPGGFGIILSLATLLAVPLGSLISGVVADIYGRRRIYGLELLLLIIGIFGLLSSNTTCGAVANGPGIIVFWMMIMGVGIGADYPLSAVITAE